jgi:hypothetical protein
MEPLTVDIVELQYSRTIGDARLGIGVGYDDPGLATYSRDGFHAFFNWQQGF